MAEATATTTTRVHEMRLVLQSADRPGSVAAVVAVLDAWSAGWLAAPLSAEADDLWLITGEVTERIGTPEYARRAHTLVQEILDVEPTGRAEADIPVVAYAGAAGVGAGCGAADDAPPGSETIRWARDAIRCEEAWALPPGPGGATQGAGIVLGQPDTGYTPHPNLGLDALDLTKDRDVIDNDDDANDPLVAPALSPWPLANPGHGTTTASVIAGRATKRPASWGWRRRRNSCPSGPSKVSCSSSIPMWPAAWNTPGSWGVTSSRSAWAERAFSACQRPSRAQWMPG